MLFSSHVFIFLFLPLTLLFYYLLNRIKSPHPAKFFLVAANFFFYGWFNPAYLYLLIGSIVVNYLLGEGLFRAQQSKLWSGITLFVGMMFNLAMLGYYKYFDFFVANINTVFTLDVPTKNLLLPLGISFFTFQQMAYLLGIYKKEQSKRYSLLTYSLFVSFFPQLIAGPIVLPDEMMPQFERPENRHPISANMAAGLWIFAIGMAKKLVLADYFAGFADDFYANTGGFTMRQSYCAILSYPLQLYFDFSGYCDMALGIGMMFNIRLPINFNSPYQSSSISDFWRKWHITLGRFLTVFVYFPLGGSRKSSFRTCINLIITFFASGLWHGAGWTFVIFGLLHGLAMVIHRFWSVTLKRRMALFAAQLVTFLFFIFSLIIFRAKDFTQVGKIYKGFFDFSASGLKGTFEDISINALLFTAVALFLIFCCSNAAGRLARFKPTVGSSILTGLLIVMSVYCMSRLSPFIYFNF